MIKTKTISVHSKGGTDVIDITEEVSRAVRESKVKNGMVNVFVSGSTASVSTIEYEPNLVKDVKRVLEKLAPSDAHYDHHKTWGDDNGSSHIRATLMGPGITVPFEDGKLMIGTWQQVVVMDFDTRARSRKVVLQVIGG